MITNKNITKTVIIAILTTSQILPTSAKIYDVAPNKNVLSSTCNVMSCLGLGLLGVAALLNSSNAMPTETDDMLLKRLHNFFVSTQEKYERMLDSFNAHEHIYNPEFTLGSLADCKYQEKSIHAYLSDLADNIYTLKSNTRKLEAHKKYLNRRYENEFIHIQHTCTQIDCLTPKMTRLVTSLQKLHDFMHDHTYYFIMDEYEATIRTQYKEELQMLNNDSDCYHLEKLEKLLHKKRWHSTDYNNYYSDYVDTIHAHIDAFEDILNNRKSAAYNDRKKYGRQLLKQMKTIKKLATYIYEDQQELYT